MRRSIVVVGLIGLAAAWVLGQVATQPAAEARLIQDLYGKRIAQALLTPDGKDNVSLARELLSAAADSANPKLLRHLLAMEAVKLAAPTGSAEGARLAREALALAEGLRKLKPTDKWRLELQISGQRYETARKAGVGIIDAGPLATKVIDARIGLAKALMAEEELEQAKSVLNIARTLARSHRLTGAESDVEAAMEALKGAVVRLERIRRAEAQLERAKLAGEKRSIRTCRQDLGLIYLLTDGDLAKANSFLAQTGHAYEAPVKAALEFTLNPKRLPPKQACNQILEALCSAAKATENREARIRIAAAGTGLCRRFLATDPGGLVATKARLLLMQMEKLAEDSPADRLVRKLKAKYGSLEGKLELLQGGVVRVAYDFSNHRQLGDWSAKEGRWQVGRIKGKDVLVGTGADRNRARLASRLRFRANKPLSLSFATSGRQDLVGVLTFCRNNDPRYGSHDLEFNLGAYGNRESFVRESGWLMWSNRSLRVIPNLTYNFQISWDGRSKITWTINGRTLCKQEIRYRSQDIRSSSLTVAVQTAGASAGFDDVKVEGTILEDPSQRL